MGTAFGDGGDSRSERCEAMVDKPSAPLVPGLEAVLERGRARSVSVVAEPADL